MRIIKIFSIICIFTSCQLLCYSQEVQKNIVIGWSKCEIEIKLDSLVVPEITHFQIVKVNDSLHINFLNRNLSQEHMKHFLNVLDCLNKKYFDNYPKSVVIVHHFTYNPRPLSAELNNATIEQYKKKYMLKDDVLVIKSGTSTAVH